MAHRRIDRVNELIRREIGNALFRLVHERDFDLSAVTVTHVETSPSLRHAQVYISIRDHRDDRKAMLDMLRKHRSEIQQQIASNLVLKYTPRLSFKIDTSLERGDHILELLSEIEPDIPPEDAPAGPEKEDT